MSSERALTATCAVDEMRVCVKHGYHLLRIHEIYEYDVKQYNLNTGEGKHFVQYIDNFLKLIMVDSGYLGWLQGSEDEGIYVQYFRESGSIELDKAAIQKNADKRD
jgi:hypothetical protein